MYQIKASMMLQAAAVFGLALLSSFGAARAEGDIEAPASADLPMAPQVKETATFTFKPVVESSKPRLTLGEMADCQGMGSICDEAYAVDMGPSPEPGKTLILAQDKLDVLLAKEWPDAHVTATGSKSVKVVAAFAELSEDEVLGALTAALEEQFVAAERFKPEVEKLALGKGVKLRPGAYHIDFPPFKGETLTGSQRLTARCVFDDGLPPKDLVVQVTFSLKEKLPVPVRAMEKGEVIGPEDVTEEWTDVGRGSQKYARTTQEVVGRRLKRPVQAMRPIESTQVEIPKIVKRGQLVKLVMKGKGLDVTGQVVAQGDGGYGQALDAVYPATKKRLRVRVVDATTVEYAF